MTFFLWGDSATLAQLSILSISTKLKLVGSQWSNAQTRVMWRYAWHRKLQFCCNSCLSFPANLSWPNSQDPLNCRCYHLHFRRTGESTSLLSMSCVTLLIYKPAASSLWVLIYILNFHEDISKFCFISLKLKKASNPRVNVKCFSSSSNRSFLVSREWSTVSYDQLCQRTAH